jgi:hypothetical protein
MITTLVLLSRLADGQWHLLIAEADRAARPLTLYVNGALEFMRVAHGTLADAHTTIEELYAWQFDGPARRDMRGVKPQGLADCRS